MDQRARDLIKHGNGLFNSRTGLVSMWQVLAENFYPERADFNGPLPDANSSDSLFSSYPVLARRELGNMFAAMLRPRSAKWFSAHVSDKRLDEDPEARAYLEYVSDVMWQVMYDPMGNFVRATKEADHDYATFGQAVIEPVFSPSEAILFYRSHHLRDCAWSENAHGKVDVMHRKWRPTARQLQQLFPDKISRAVTSALKEDPEKIIDCRHIVVPDRLYRMADRSNKKRFPFASLYIESESETVLEEVPRRTLGYLIPRWETVSGSQYARSPATEVALADGRTLQVVVRTLREAGEKHVDPPMLARQEALRSDIALHSGGITFYDNEDGADDRNNDPLRPIDFNGGAMPIGADIAASIREDIRNGMFLDKLMLPQIDARAMTAFEVRRRIEEYVRAAAPLFEPVEEDYNAPLCNETFEILKTAGAFGPIDAVPQSLLRADIHFTFQSPLRNMADANKASVFVQGLGMMGQAAQFDPALTASVDIGAGLKDSLRAMGYPATWIADDKKVEAVRQQLQQKAAAQQGITTLGAGADIGTRVGDAAHKLSQAGIL